jgi:electron transfer flavoprotein-quinone oxidoreductase
VTEKVDVIVVGAGLAGSAAALELARADANVMLVERAQHPGEKNVSGGLLLSRILDKIVPCFWEDAPIERIVTGYRVSMLGGKQSTTLDYRNPRLARPPYDGFTVNRRKFDSWLAKRAEESGAMLVSGIRVDEPLIENGRVAGILSAEDEVRADVVIAADGINSRMAIGAGLRDEYKPHEMALGVKEVISLPRDVIEDRFGLSGNQGVAHLFLGATKGTPGGGFLYTNLESVSLGNVIHLTAFEKSRVSARDFVDYLRNKPMIENLVKDGELLEYSAHLVPEAGYDGLSKLYGDGMLVAGDAAGLVLNLGFTIEGMNYALASGLAAARTAKAALEKRDYSARFLKRYKDALSDLGVLTNLRTFRRVPAMMSNPRLSSTYPNLVNAILRDMFTSNLKPRSKLMPTVLNHIMRGVPLPALLQDALQGARAL